MELFCPACGTQRADGSSFCGQCGHHYAPAASGPEPAAAPVPAATVAPPPLAPASASAPLPPPHGSAPPAAGRRAAAGGRGILVGGIVLVVLFGIFMLVDKLGLHRHRYGYGQSYSYDSGSGHSSGGATTFLCLFMLLLGCGLLAWGLRSRSKAGGAATAAAGWPTVPGVIVASMVADILPLWTIFSAANPSQSHYYEPRVRYRYTVGREFEGSRIRFGSVACRTGARARELAAPYPEGAPVTVRYDPANPAESVLELAASRGSSMAGIVLGAILAMGGLALLLASTLG